MSHIQQQRSQSTWGSSRRWWLPASWLSHSWTSTVAAACPPDLGTHLLHPHNTWNLWNSQQDPPMQSTCSAALHVFCDEQWYMYIGNNFNAWKNTFGNELRKSTVYFMQRAIHAPWATSSYVFWLTILSTIFAGLATLEMSSLCQRQNIGQQMRIIY